MSIDNKRMIRINQRIRAEEVRLIAEDGAQIGVVSLEEALKQAEEAGVDLIEISPGVTPPVCKIFDFKKYCYLIEKRDKENKKKQRQIEIKEIKFSPMIEDHDYQTKLRHCEKFLKRGDRVKVSMFFRGRERAHIDIGQNVIKRVCEDLSEVSLVDKDYGLKGSSIILILAPKKSK